MSAAHADLQLQRREQGNDRGLREDGKRNAKAVMDATRAGMGCGSCKAMVTEIVEWACGGETKKIRSVHYYVPGVPLTKPELIRAIRERNLRSVSAVFDYLGGRQGRRREQAGPRLAAEDAVAR